MGHSEEVLLSQKKEIQFLRMMRRATPSLYIGGKACLLCSQKLDSHIDLCLWWKGLGLIS